MMHPLTMAQEHAEAGRRIVIRQRNIIAELREHGRSTTIAEDLLAYFERRPSNFEDDLSNLLRNAREV